MGDARRVGLMLALVAGLVLMIGCSSTGTEGPTTIFDPNTTIKEIEPAPKPMWVNSLGLWEEDWTKDHKDEGARFLWVVGTSQPVESIRFEQNAEKSASDQAIFELVRALGVTIDSLNLRTEAWSNETRDLVIGTYKEALEHQMARHEVNFKNYAWFGYVIEEPGIGGYKQQSYIKKGLYRLDKKSLSNSLAEDTAEEFAEKMKERVKANVEAQKELVNRAKELTKKRIQNLIIGD